MSESHSEQIERAQWMADPDQGCTWDLSENDRAAIKAVLKDRADLLAAVKLIWSMFDDGRIVRNISNDGKPDWALKILTFTRELQTIHAALIQADQK